MAKKILLTVFGVLLFVGFAAAVYTSALAFQFPSSSSEIANNSTASQTSNSLPTAQPTNTPTANLSFCGMTDDSTILVVGENKTNQKSSHLDTIWLVKMDIHNHLAIVYSIPHDLILNTPSLNKYNSIQGRLGNAYYIVRDSESKKPDSDLLATNQIAQILYDNFGVVSNHYFHLTNNFAVTIIDAIGGVEVNAPADYSSSNLKIKVGQHKFNGGQTLAYTISSTLVNPMDELARYQRQQSVLLGLKKRFSDAAVLSMAPDLYSKWINPQITDLTLKQVTDAICFFSSISDEAVQFKSIPTDSLVGREDGSMVITDISAIQKSIQQLFQPTP
jgi:LCP family protein required for cell wall assembly